MSAIYVFSASFMELDGCRMAGGVHPSPNTKRPEFLQSVRSTRPSGVTQGGSPRTSVEGKYGRRPEQDLAFAKRDDR